MTYRQVFFYRYFDTFGHKALFPFGFGLSYTDFDISCKEVEAKASLITLKAVVKNIGHVLGKEVVQAYISLPEGKLPKAFKELAGFAKTKLLAPGEEEKVEISFDIKDFSSYDEMTASYILEKGEYIVRVGNSSASLEVVCVASLDQTVTVLKTKNCLGNSGFKDIIAPSFDRGIIPATAARINIYAMDIVSREVFYNQKYEIDESVKELTDEELCYLAIGGFEICVRNSQPHAVMTSYNLLNGTHTAEHRGLIEDVLRSEFGFEGIVMTDWVMSAMDSKMSIYRNSLSNEVAKAGGDLFMPGGRKDYENVMNALKNKKIERKQLEINATRVVRMSKKLR